MRFVSLVECNLSSSAFLETFAGVLSTSSSTLFWPLDANSKFELPHPPCVMARVEPKPLKPPSFTLNLALFRRGLGFALCRNSALLHLSHHPLFILYPSLLNLHVQTDYIGFGATLRCQCKRGDK